MKNIIAKYKKNYVKNIEIIQNNQDEIKADNKQVLAEISFASILILIPLILISFIIEPERFLYISFAIASLISFIMFKNMGRILGKVNTVLIQYALLILIFTIAVYVGIVTNTNNYAVVLPAFFALAPTLFIDKTKNILAFFMTTYCISVVFIFCYKDPVPLAINDCINCSVFLLVGLLMGNAVTNARLASIQSNKDLMIRENTDFLTNLPNRRKLFDQFINGVNFHGVIMLDIDDFKKYNDTYGHQKGDYVLKSLAKCFMEMANGNLEFLRYGGEEFIGIYRRGSVEELTKICNDLNETIRKMKIPHSSTDRGYVTASIGFYFSSEPIIDEIAIHYADIALYKAKSSGKDISTLYQKSMEVLSTNMTPTCRVK